MNRPNHDLSRHYESSAFLPCSVDRVFEHIDDHTRLSSHMGGSSWMMGGGQMRIEFDEGRGQRVGSQIRLAGRVFGLHLSVEEVVTERIPPYRKSWETIGCPRLLIIAHYRMGFELAPQGNGCVLRVFIDYALPDRAPARWLGFLFAKYYARWCTERMIRDTAESFRLKNAPKKDAA